jgi:hypothetical protein
MKNTLNLWLSKNARISGVQACGVRYPDGSVFSQSWAPNFSLSELEKAWGIIGESFQVLQLNRLPQNRLRWVYSKTLLFGARRQDNICLGVFTTSDSHGLNLDTLESILSEFEHLKAVNS